MGRRVWVPVVSGPLAPYAAEFASWLASRAYSRKAAANRLYQFDQLSRWLEREGLGVGELTGGQAERFAAARRAAGLVTWAAPRSAMLPVGYLRALGVAPAATSMVARGPLEELLEDYCRYLRVERAVCDHTVLDAYVPAARLFLAGWDGPVGLGLERMRAADVSSFLARECPKRSVTGARDLVCALRSLLRYLHLAGLDRRAACVGGPVGRRSAGSLASARSRSRRGHEAVGQLRSAHAGRPARLRGSVVAGAAGASRRRGRRDQAG